MKNIKERQKKQPLLKTISKETKERSDVAKKYIEKKYQKHFEEEK